MPMPTFVRVRKILEESQDYQDMSHLQGSIYASENDNRMMRQLENDLKKALENDLNGKDQTRYLKELWQDVANYAEQYKANNKQKVEA